METAIRILDILNFPITVAYTITLFFTLSAFIPPRKHPAVKLLGLVLLHIFAQMIIFFGDPLNMLAALAILIAYILLFHQGTPLQKATAVLIFYPTVISVSFLQQNLFSDLFFFLSDAPSDTAAWSVETQFFSTAVWHCSQVCRLLFWIAAYFFVRRYKTQIQSVRIGKRPLLIADAVTLIASAAIFTTQIFVAEYKYITYPLCAVVIVTGFSGIALIAYMSVSEQTAREAEHLKIQHNYYLEKMKSEERVRAVYHDMKNHLLVLEQQSGSADAANMAAELQKQIVDYEDYVHTGNAILDVILKEKSREMREKQIDFSVTADLNGIDFLAPLDISAIFGNGLDNAVEAAEKLPQAQRAVILKAGKVQNFFSVLLENTCITEAPPSKKRTTKQDALWHGFGISSIKKSVEKYGGQTVLKAENGKFTLKILIPIP